jgi:BirA family biotin operon repressor/biotin-[acetyl-CoA-carboxylase] ligase
LTIGLAERLGVRVVEHGAIASTMDAALADPGPAPVVHLAASQSAGRGRFGREWRSPPGNLYATIRWTEREEPFPPGLLGAIQLEWARTIEEVGGPPVRCKWPNDGWLDGAKWSGLLATRPAGRPGEIHLGMGANLVTVPAVEGVAVACLRSRWPEWPGEAEVTALLLGAALRVLRDGPAGVASRLADWPRHDALTPGERLVVDGPDGPIEGAYLEVDPEGRLRLDGPAGEVRVSSGDARRVRPA